MSLYWDDQIVQFNLLQDKHESLEHLGDIGLCRTSVCIHVRQMRLSKDLFLLFFCRLKSGFRTAVPSRRRTKGRTRSCVLWCRKRRRPVASSDFWSRGGCWRPRACRASCHTAAGAPWARPCALPPWPCLATAAAAATAEAAAARRAAALRCPPSPAQGQWRACRAHRPLTAFSASPCRPYSAASPPAFHPTLCPWLARWLATCRNFLHGTWAPPPLSLTHGPMAKNPWTRKFWNDCGFYFFNS